MRDIIIAGIEGGLREGGWAASGEVFSNAGQLQYYQAVDVWYDMFSGGGWHPFVQPAFRGHLMPDPFRKTFQASVTNWSAFTGQQFLKEWDIQGIFFKNVGSPANQHQIAKMTYAEIVRHIIGQSGQYGHCNLVRGVWPEGVISLNVNNTNSNEVAEYEVKQGGFWDTLSKIAGLDEYIIYFGKDNSLNYIPHPMFGTLPTPVFTITSALMLEPLTIEKRNVEKIGQVKVQGTTPAGLQLTGKYPTSPQPGPVVVKSGYLATSAANLNDMAERIYKFNNRDYIVTVVLPGAIGLMLEIVDRVAITYTSATDGITWSEKKFWINKIIVDIGESFTAKTTLTLDAENA